MRQDKLSRTWLRRGEPCLSPYILVSGQLHSPNFSSPATQFRATVLQVRWVHAPYHILVTAQSEALFEMKLANHLLREVNGDVEFSRESRLRVRLTLVSADAGL